MRQGILFALVCGTMALVLASTAGADPPRTSCPNGFTAYPVPQTETELRQFPRIAAGLDAVPAPYTAEELIALGGLIDGNADGTFCLKAISNLRGSSTKAWEYFYGARDNDTAAA
jgi:hypothetical protein